MAVEFEGESGGGGERRRVWKRTCRVHNNVRLMLGGLLFFSLPYIFFFFSNNDHLHIHNIFGA